MLDFETANIIYFPAALVANGNAGFLLSVNRGKAVSPDFASGFLLNQADRSQDVNTYNRFSFRRLDF